MIRFKRLVQVGVLVVLAGFLCGSLGWAADGVVAVDTTFAPPEWLVQVLLWLKSMPYIGPVLVEIAKWAGVVSVILTAFASFMIVLAKAFDGFSSITAHFQWAGRVADWINAIVPYLKWASLYNQPQPWKISTGTASTQIEAKPEEKKGG